APGHRWLPERDRDDRRLGDLHCPARHDLPARGERRPRRSHHGGKRHGQGAGRRSPPRRGTAPRRPVHRGQLLGDHGDPVRERAVRPRAGRLHGRRPLAPGARGGGGGGRPGGAAAPRRGLAEMADGGTLFLDEIGDMPLSCQAKLLRFLDDQTFLRVGGTRKVRVSTQIVAATNRDLKAMVAEGTFRGDLYYRLLVAPIALTPLRARPDDILPLPGHWLARITPHTGIRGGGFTPEAEQRLLTYGWPGNVREMRNLIERLVILCPGDLIGAEQLPPEIAPTLPESAPEDVSFLYRIEAARAGAEDPATAGESVPPPSLDEIGHAHIRMVLQKMNGNKTKAAEAL